MGDYDKIGPSSLQDGVGRLTRFSPWDDHAHLASSTSVAIQHPRRVVRDGQDVTVRKVLSTVLATRCNCPTRGTACPARRSL